MSNIYSNIEKQIGYSFKNRVLLENAITHSSYAHENNTKSNETLEFFGDSILSFVVSKKLFGNITSGEGELSKKRAKIVCSDNLSDAIRKMGIDSYLLIGKSLKNGSGASSAVIGDMFEAIVAAIYLDGGLNEAEKFILSKVNFDDAKHEDYKTTLQEIVQAKSKKQISYIEEARTGPAHSPMFTVSLFIGNEKYATAIANTKQLAESECACIAIKKLKK